MIKNVKEKNIVFRVDKEDEALLKLISDGKTPSYTMRQLIREKAAQVANGPNNPSQ